MIPIESYEDIVLGDNARPGRTPQAQTILEVSFMLCCFAELGAPVTPPLLGWARGNLWRNGETGPK